MKQLHQRWNNTKWVFQVEYAKYNENEELRIENINLKTKLNIALRKLLAERDVSYNLRVKRLSLATSW